MDETPAAKGKDAKRPETTLLSKAEPSSKDNKEVKPGRSRARSIWGKKKDK